MGAGPAGGNSGGGGADRDTYNPLTGKQYSKPKPKKKKAKGLIPGFVEALKKGQEVDRKKRKEAKINDSYLGSPDYQGDVKAPPTIKEVLDEQAKKDQRDRDVNPTPKIKIPSGIPKVNTAPTEAEVSQSAATDTTAVAETKKEDDVYTRKRKSKARGRSMMTLTSAQGLKKDDNLVLGKRTLLGS